MAGLPGVGMRPTAAGKWRGEKSCPLGQADVEEEEKFQEHQQDNSCWLQGFHLCS